MRNFLIELTDTLSLIFGLLGWLTLACWLSDLHRSLLYRRRGGHA